MQNRSIEGRTFAMALLAALQLAAGCDNPRYCPGRNANDDCSQDAGGDSESGCTSNAQCSTATPVCDLAGSKTCVQCVAPDQIDACTGAMPVCGDDDACRGCAAHGECASGACLPDGSCGDEASVAYVAPAGTGSACTKASPCGTLDAGVATDKAYVKVGAGLVRDNKTTTIDAKAVTILADPGAILDRDGDGVVLEVRNTGADVRIFDLQISGASGGPGDVGISIPSGGTPKLTLTGVKVSGNVGGGISASGGTLTVARSTISGNAGGGISASACQFEIVNSVITSNGSGTSAVGGIKVDNITTAGTHKIEFSTITANLGPATVNTGVSCGTVIVPVTISSSIVYANIVAGGGKQIGGSANCLATYSDVGPDASTGMGNINADPMFINAAQGDFHIQPSSPCKDAADSSATLAVDIDGETRPRGNARDIGADEVP